MQLAHGDGDVDWLGIIRDTDKKVLNCVAEEFASVAGHGSTQKRTERTHRLCLNFLMNRAYTELKNIVRVPKQFRGPWRPVSGLLKRDSEQKE
jgi:hypothetical protein